MVVYSHSRLSTFEQCPLKFKYKYIDKIKPEIEASIEGHLGSTVHNTLEWLYKQVLNKNIPSIDGVITFYSDNWQQNYTSKIVIVKKFLTAEDYFNKGVQFLLNYYLKNQPFEENTLEIEKRIMVNLDEAGLYKITGFIDRLTHNLETNEIEIHDYKTANSLPTQDKIDQDRQLALYALAIKELFGPEKEICLVWHYLAHDKKICSRRTNEQLQKLKQDTLNQIKQIEATTEFPAQKTPLCGWCEFKPICPKWNFGQSKLS